MSQQARITFAVCLSFALVAFVSCQGIDANGCSSSFQKAVDSYNEEMTKAVRDLVSQLSKQGQSAANVQQLTNSLNEITGNLTQVGKTENLQDASKLSKIAAQTFQAYIKLGSQIFRTEPLTDGITLYTAFAAKSLTLYTSFINSVISACGPTRGAAKQ